MIINKYLLINENINHKKKVLEIGDGFKEINSFYNLKPIHLSRISMIKKISDESYDYIFIYINNVKLLKSSSIDYAQKLLNNNGKIIVFINRYFNINEGKNSKVYYSNKDLEFTHELYSMKYFDSSKKILSTIIVYNYSNVNYDYIKISDNRYKKYCIYTMIDYNTNEVYKKPIFKQAIPHLQSMTEHSSMLNGIYYHKYQYLQNSLKCSLIQQESIDRKLNTYVLNNEINKADEIMSRLKVTLYQNKKQKMKYSKTFKDFFGSKKTDSQFHILKSCSIDFKLDNVFLNDKNIQLIDHEWIIDTELPAEFILWRCIKYSNINNQLYAKKHLLDFLEMDKDVLDIFNSWDLHFSIKYVGGRLGYK